MTYCRWGRIYYHSTLMNKQKHTRWIFIKKCLLLVYGDCIMSSQNRAGVKQVILFITNIFFCLISIPNHYRGIGILASPWYYILNILRHSTRGDLVAHPSVWGTSPRSGQVVFYHTHTKTHHDSHRFIGHALKCYPRNPPYPPRIHFHHSIEGWGVARFKKLRNLVPPLATLRPSIAVVRQGGSNVRFLEGIEKVWSVFIGRKVYVAAPRNPLWKRFFQPARFIHKGRVGVKINRDFEFSKECMLNGM